MNSTTSKCLDIESTSDHSPEDLFLVVGAGHFGKRAVKILREISNSPILIVDKDKDQFESINVSFTEKIVSDGVRYLAKNIQFLNPSSIVIPAVPVHLAYNWLKFCLKEQGWKIAPRKVPEELMPLLPHTWQGMGRTLLISYADFLCPDDCPEPSGQCLVTGETRPEPLHERLSSLMVHDHKIHIIKSRQLAPGLGGYRVEDLTNLLKNVGQGEGKWLVGTACKCHGTLTAFEVKRQLARDLH